MGCTWRLVTTSCKATFGEVRLVSFKPHGFFKRMEVLRLGRAEGLELVSRLGANI